MNVARAGKPARSRRRRPGWQRSAGAVAAVAAIVLIIVNDAILVGLSTPLPGGHSEGYFLFGLVAASAGLWLTGVFDARGG